MASFLAALTMLIIEKIYMKKVYRETFSINIADIVLYVCLIVLSYIGAWICCGVVAEYFKRLRK